MNLAPIETEYAGYRFRSRLEARWAVFFDACGVEWEYEQEGYVLPDGTCYLPDFLLHGVVGRTGATNGDIYVEVKGKLSDEDRRKVDMFCGPWKRGTGETYSGMTHPVAVLGNIPNVEDDDSGFCDFFNDWWAAADRDMEIKSPYNTDYFNFTTIDGDWYPFIPAIDKKTGRLELVGADYTDEINVEETKAAYRLARQARFEHGEKPASRRTK